jgi:uncharacterized heparinase superfamily protein
MLWAYNLHYFDDLNAFGAEERAAAHSRLLERWVRENPPGQGIGWHPYPTARRIVNWSKWALRGNELARDCEESLAVQARWLRRNLEYHLLGNHLLADAKALLYAGLHFGGVEGDEWCAKAMSLLERELAEQVLPDGGHFELSTMYHALVLEDLLDIVNVLIANGLTVPAVWREATGSMQRWLQAMSHPDGNISFFNDAAFDVAPTVAELDAYAIRLGLSTPSLPPESFVVLRESGYVRAALGPAHLLCDCAAIGPNYLPGHAHADTLSFELSIGAERVFVNSGTSEYGTGAERQRQRGTAAHNAVVVDGMDSSEVWSGFRVARRARARLSSATYTNDIASIEASHDGYKRLYGGGDHRRQWVLESGSLSVDDAVGGRFHDAIAYFHLHPGVTAEMRDGRNVALRTQGGVELEMSFSGASRVELEPGTWHPGFGLAVPNYRIIASFAGSSLSTRIAWNNDSRKH